MGGFDTMITEKTKNILIESAWFEPAGIRRTARRHGMHTDASHRFERGTDIDNVIFAADRAASLMAEFAGGEVLSGIIDEYPEKKSPKIFSFCSPYPDQRLTGHVWET